MLPLDQLSFEDVVEDASREARDDHRVAERARELLAAAALGLVHDHPRDRRVRHARELARLAFRDEGQRHHVRLGDPGVVLDQQEDDRRRAVALAHPQHVEDRGALARPRLAAEPALEGEVFGEERRHLWPRRGLEHGCPGAGHVEPRRLPCAVGDRGGRLSLEIEPEEPVRPQGEEVRSPADDREPRPAEHLRGRDALEPGEVEMHALGEARQVGDDQDGLPQLADERQNARVLRVEEGERAAAKQLVFFPLGEDALHPPEQGGGVRLLGLDVDRLVVVLGIDDDGQIELLRVGAGEAGVAIRAPLHGRADAVAIAQIDENSRLYILLIPSRMKTISQLLKIRST